LSPHIAAKTIYIASSTLILAVKSNAKNATLTTKIATKKLYMVQQNAINEVSSRVARNQMQSRINTAADCYIIE